MIKRSKQGLYIIGAIFLSLCLFLSGCRIEAKNATTPLLTSTTKTSTTTTKPVTGTTTTTTKTTTATTGTSTTTPTSGTTTTTTTKLTTTTPATGITTSTTTTATTATTTTPTTATTTTTSGTTRTVSDKDGNNVVIPAVITKVAPFTGDAALMTALLGDSGEIVAAPDASLSDYFKQVFPAYATANSKKLLSTKPDDVITSGAQVIYGPITDAAQIAQYKALGIAVVSLNNFATVAQLKDNLTKIAAILGGDAPTKATAFGAWIDTQAAYCNTKIGGLGKVKVMLLNSTAGVLSTVNSSDILSAYMTTGGGTNVAADLTTVTNITAAQVVQLNPDVIITMNAASKTAIMALAGLQNVPAVYNSKVYVIPTGTFLWSIPTAEDALMPLWLAKTLHGEYLGDLDMNKTVKDFYSKFYGYTATDAEVTAILAGK